jgi:hypothetical protein
MITSLKNKKEKRLEIDLTGPDGNVFNLISIGMNLCKELNKRRGAEYFNIKEFQLDMLSGDYEHSINVMEKNFGHLIIMYR